jgi:hypothetical protein
VPGGRHGPGHALHFFRSVRQIRRRRRPATFDSDRCSPWARRRATDRADSPAADRRRSHPWHACKTVPRRATDQGHRPGRSCSHSVRVRPTSSSVSSAGHMPPGGSRSGGFALGHLDERGAVPHSGRQRGRDRRGGPGAKEPLQRFDPSGSCGNRVTPCRCVVETCKQGFVIVHVEFCHHLPRGAAASMCEGVAPRASFPSPAIVKTCTRARLFPRSVESSKSFATPHCRTRTFSSWGTGRAMVSPRRAR